MLAVADLTLLRGGNRLVESFSHAFAAGNVHVVLGPNGAGKSTLLLALAGMIKAESGDVNVVIRGAAARSVASCSRQTLSQLMAWQGDLPSAEFGLTVGQRLLLAAGDSPDEMRLCAAVDAMDIEGLQHRDMAALSSGERQRVELAAIMQRDVPIWLLDEPTSHLDLRHQAAALAMLRREAERGRLIVTVLHDLLQASSIADEVLLLDGSGRVEAGAAKTLLTSQRASELFGLPVHVCTDGKGQPCLLPEFIGGNHETA
ncbi:MAG TPA: ABC transporter ATP-binding protein [Mariprofundaceae bacterium]|nr:ABC transporter ATP-binding protein [Mariprofundaceae bacterium]